MFLIGIEFFGTRELFLNSKDAKLGIKKNMPSLYPQLRSCEKEKCFCVEFLGFK